MKNNKTQIFMFDLIFSIVIIIVSLGILANYFLTTSSSIDIYDLNNEILNGFTQTKINSLNSLEIREMFINNQIKNIDNSVAQQVSEFYYLNNISLAKNLTKIFVKDYILTSLNFNLSINNGTNNIELFSLINTNKNYKDSELTSYSSREIFGFINSTSYYGPYTFSIRIWV